MKKYLLVFLFCCFSIGSLQAKADIYLATGVLTDKDSTDTARDQLEIDLKRSNPEIYASQEFKSVDSTSHGFWDFIESAAQLLGQNGWSLYWNSFITLTHSALTQHYIDYFSGVSANHGTDLSLQIANYKASINAGNQVIVIAHSQGNYFTNEVYDTLDECQKKSFYMLGTANPASKVSGMNEGRGALVTLDNDPITYVPSSMGANITNDERFTVAGLDMEHYKFHFFEYYRYTNSVTKSSIDTFPEYAIHHFNTNNSHTSTPVSGLIDIKLSWENPSIHMNLSSAIGTKDISYTGCNPLEHYYVQSEDEVVPGTYAVHVSNLGSVDDSYLPQSIDLVIHAPGAVAVFDFNITAVDMLNLGHVADIIISEKKILEIVNVGTNTDYTTVKCYGNCGGYSGGSSGTYLDYLYEIQSKLKQALLGPLSNAEISLSDAADFKNNVPFYLSSTSAGNSLLTSGIFYFPSSVLGSLASEKLYVLSVVGGEDIDANDDRVLDTTPTQNSGTIHAILSGDRLKNENFKVNIITEVIYQISKNTLNSDLNTTAMYERLDELSKRLLFEDLTNDGVIDYNDALAWLPSLDKNKLLKSYETYYQPIVEKIYNNESIYNEAYALAYEPFFRDTKLYVDENTTAGTVVGKVKLLLAEGVVNYYLGEGSNLFDVSLDGNISLNTTALDYEGARSHQIYITTEVDGEYYTAQFNIIVNNILELPILKELSVSIYEDTPPLSKIGNIEILSSDGISQIILEGEGSDLFDIDRLGNIRTAAIVTRFNYNYKNRYTFKAYAINQLGESERVNVNIDIILPYAQ